MNKRNSQIIKRPILTEKSAQLAAVGTYTFEVSPDANKVEIKNALSELIASLYPDKKTEAVKVATVATRDRFSRRKRHGRAPKDGKKAYVTIAGDALDFFES